MNIADINHRLETCPYFNIRFDYNIEITLHDSIKMKMIKALNRELPKSFVDSAFAFTEQVKNNIIETAWKRCGTDTACFHLEYEKIYNREIEFQKKVFYNNCYSGSLVLSCGNWNVKEAIPYLEKELQNRQCNYLQNEISMALAKLGHDSIKQILEERYTLDYLLKNTEADTINDEIMRGGEETMRFLSEGYSVAMYLKNKKILLNLMDIIYIRGKHDNNVWISYIVAEFIRNIYISQYFDNYPNFEKLSTVCADYASAIEHFEDKKLTKKDKLELKKLLSAEYRTKIKEQLRQWIIENINFEE
jgi:hypothetical protein